MGKSARWILGFFGVKRSPKFPQDDCSLDGSSKEPHLKRGTKEKRRWSLGGRKPSSRTHFELDQTLVQNGHPGKQTFGSMDIMEQEQKSKHAVAVAVAAAAEAALAADVARLTGNDLPRNETSNRDRDHLAAIKVQTAFRGHLARRALRALKAVVRLQALFRGQQVRKQAAMTLQCMQALVKVQARARARARHVGMSEEGHTVRGQLSQRRRSQQAYPRTSVEEWNASSGRKEKLQAKAEKKQQAATNCERLLAYESTQYSSTPPRAGWSWIDRWMVGRSPVLRNPKGGNGGGIGMEISSEESSSIFGPASAKRSNFRISKKRMGCTADSFSLDHISSAAIHTWPSPPVDSFRSTDRSPSTRMALKQRANSTTHQAQQLVCFASTPNSLSCRSRSSSVGGLPVPGLDHMSTGCQLALKENHILEQEEYYDITSNSADSSLAFSSTGPHSAKHTGFFGFPGMDQKENILHFPKYMTATKSTEAKVRSQSAPKQRPAASEKQYVPAASGKIRYSPSWADKPSYSTTRGSDGKSQFQRSVSQVRTRSKVSAASGF